MQLSFYAWCFAVRMPWRSSWRNCSSLAEALTALKHRPGKVGLRDLCRRMLPVTERQLCWPRIGGQRIPNTIMRWNDVTLLNTGIRVRIPLDVIIILHCPTPSMNCLFETVGTGSWEPRRTKIDSYPKQKAHNVNRTCLWPNTGCLRSREYCKQVHREQSLIDSGPPLFHQQVLTTR